MRIDSGYELGCQELAEKYIELGHSVLVATSENTPKLANYPEPKHIDVRRIFSPIKYYDEGFNQHFQTNTIYFYEKVMAFGGYVESNCIALKRLIENENPDLIWIFNPLGLGPVGILDTAISCQTKVIIHLMEHIDRAILDHNQLFDLKPKWRYLKSQTIAVSCSKKMIIANSLLGEYKHNKLVYNSLKLQGNQVYTPPSEQAFNKHKSDIFRLVYFGQIAEKKGVLLLLNLAKKIVKSHYKSRMIIDIYGRGEKNILDYLQKQLDLDPELSSVFAIKGFLSKNNLMQRLSEYDLAIFLLSNDEPFAYAPIDAMLAGLPVILTSGTGVSEVLTNNYDVIFVEDRNNISDVYSKVILSLEDRNKLRAISENAIKTIERYFDLDSVAIPQLNNIIEGISPSKGYSFEYVLAICETIKYPYFELAVTNHLSGARYKFIDKLVNYFYKIPFFGKKGKTLIKFCIEIYKKYR